LLLYDTGSLGGTDLGLLLGALPQLQGMYMPQRWASNQPPFDEVLRRVRALHVKYWASSIDLLQLLPSWTNLQHLSFIGVHFPKHPSVPLDACSSLVGLRNLVIQDTTMTNEGLAVLCSATGLRHLDVTHNTNVTALPKAISRLTSLHTLIMVHTKIYSLPWGTTALRSLRKLVWEARMPRGSPTNAAEPQLHQVVWQLRSLQHLTISLGTTVTLSPAIGDLTGLRQLCVDGAIKEVPESIGRLVGLEQLTLRSYLLRELPSSITALSQLTCIRLDCHQLQLQELSPAVQAFVRPRLQLLGPSGWV
jgi:Leucine-rich repeat (LRR) protein